MNTGWNTDSARSRLKFIINLLGNEYWLEQFAQRNHGVIDYKPTGK